MLFRQNFIHHNKLFLFSSIAYIGVIFILLSIVQMGSDKHPHDLENYRGFLIGFVAVFGILYVGYSFPSLRSKESTINYLMVPGSVLEKFLSEFIIRIVLMLFLLPILFWVTFNIQGLFFGMFTEDSFQTVGLFEPFNADLSNVIKGDIFNDRSTTMWFVIMLANLIGLGLVLPFTGGATFSKQPLVKTLFALAVIVLFYVLVIYLAIEIVGVGNFRINDDMILIPNDEKGSIRFFAMAAFIANLVMLYVAYRKLKEKEV